MYRPSPEHLGALQKAAPRAAFAIAESEADARQLIADADVVLGNRWFLQSLPCARRLRWMQSNSMGVDPILRAGEALQGITLTCARGVYDEEIAEHAVALVLALTRGLHRARDDQRDRHWPRYALRTVAGSRALVLGWGGIGRAVARKLRSLGALVEGVRRGRTGPPTADDTGFLVHGPDTWRDALSHAHYLVLALPLTTETRYLVGASELAQLPAHAHVVNVGRGGTLDNRRSWMLCAPDGSAEPRSTCWRTSHPRPTARSGASRSCC